MIMNQLMIKTIPNFENIFDSEKCFSLKLEIKTNYEML